MSDNAKVKAGRDLIIDALKETACLKQQVYSESRKSFTEFKQVLSSLESSIAPEISKTDERVDVHFKDIGDYEAHFFFGGDMLLFNHHTNIFNFEDEHGIHKLPYVVDDPSRSYCAMISIYNFLADSFRFNRVNDVGTQIARIFINRDNHFFVEGKGQLGFLYDNFEAMTLTPEYVRAIVESAILFTIDFDLLAPSFDETANITLEQKIMMSGRTPMSTAKRMGYKFKAEQERPE